MSTTFDRIVYFGDSLSDGGTIFDVTSQLLFIPFPLASSGYAGVFSDGPVHTQIAPTLLDVDVANYAAGGARAIGAQPIGDLLSRNGADLLINPAADPALLDFDINLGGQVARFLGDEVANPSQQDTAASFFIGLNDIGAFTPTTADPVAEATALLGGIVGSTIGAVEQVVTAGGVDSVILYTFPQVTFFPSSAFVDPALLPLGNLLVDAHTDAIKASALALNLAGIETQVVELGQITGEITADMGTFGFLSMGPVWFGAATNPDISVGPGGVELTFPPNPAVAGLDADQIVFFDLLHPTTALHGIIAAFSTAVLTEQTHFLSDGDDVRLTGRGDDFVLAKGGDDRVWLGNGDDTGFGGIGDDIVHGGRGSDLISGGSGDDVLFGGSGSDLLADGDGDDRSFGGTGNDILVLGRGSDTAFGGLGNDSFLWTDPALNGGADGSHDLLFGGFGRDTLYLAVAQENREAVSQEIADTGWFAQKLGIWDLESLGVKTFGIEKIVLVDDRADLAALDFGGDRGDLLNEADLWGLV